MKNLGNVKNNFFCIKLGSLDYISYICSVLGSPRGLSVQSIFMI